MINQVVLKIMCFLNTTLKYSSQLICFLRSNLFYHLKISNDDNTRKKNGKLKETLSIWMNLVSKKNAAEMKKMAHLKRKDLDLLLEIH
jgi:hypothetical protein